MDIPPFRVAVLGAGTMGAGIAQLFLQHGFPVRLRDIDEGQLDQARKRIEAGLAKGVEKGKLTQKVADRALNDLTTTTDLAAALDEVRVCIEAVPEVPDLKRRVLKEAEEHLGAEDVLATNTSSLSIASLAEGLERPDRFVGMHFFNPPYVMKLLEIVQAETTSDQTVSEAVAIAQGVTRDPIVVRDSPGFATSRLGVVVGLEAMRMLEQGVASAEDLDKAMELGYGWPMGPLKLTDLVGLDVRLDIAEHLHEELGGDQYEPPAILREKVAAGELGKKSGKGFYAW